MMMAKGLDGQGMKNRRKKAKGTKAEVKLLDIKLSI